MNSSWMHFSNLQIANQSDPMMQQKEWLRACLKHNRISNYGNTYHFEKIQTIEDFQTLLPIVDYQYLSPWIDALIKGKKNQLFAGPVIAYETTGGSLGGSKLIPYSARGLADFRTVLLDWLANLITTHNITYGKAYWALSPSLNERQEINRIPVGGGDALYLGEDNLTAFSQLSAVPFSIGFVTDVDHWAILTLYHLINADDLRLVSIWSPSFFIQLINGLTKYRAPLLSLLEFGGEIEQHILNKNHEALMRYKIYLNTASLSILWPNLSVISAWSDASSHTLANRLKAYFPHAHFQPKGLLSTEGVITTPDKNDQPLLSIAANFYEFRDKTGAVFLLDQLKTDHEYEVIITTNSGLYRYKTDDLVHCTGHINQIPILKFVGRSSTHSDLVGEKLTEPFVNQALSSLKGFAMLAVNPDQQGYTLLLDRENAKDNHTAIEQIEQIEQELYKNPQYAYARMLGQLQPLAYQIIKDPMGKFLNHQRKQGKRLGDIKIPALFTLGNWVTLFTGEYNDPSS